MDVFHDIAIICSLQVVYFTSFSIESVIIRLHASSYLQEVALRFSCPFYLYKSHLAFHYLYVLSLLALHRLSQSRLAFNSLL